MKKQNTKLPEAINRNIQIDFDGKTLFIGEENSSGCKYKIANKRNLLERVLDYVADILDEEGEYSVSVYKNER